MILQPPRLVIENTLAILSDTGYDSFTVTVSRPDTTPPTVNVPDDITTTTSSIWKIH